MTPPPTEPQPNPIDPTVLAVLIRGTLDTLPHHPDAPPDEIAALQQAAYTIISTLNPRDVLQAMLAARIAAAHFHIQDSLRVAAQPNLSPTAKARYRTCAASLSRMRDAARREFFQRQAGPPLHPAALPVALPAPRPRPAPAPAPMPRPARPAFVAPTQAEIQQLVAGAEAILDAQAAAAAKSQPAAPPPPATDPAPADPELDRLIAHAQAYLAEIAQPQPDFGEHLQAEIDARKAAATALAA